MLFTRYIPNKDLSVNKYAIEKYRYSDFYNEIEDYVLNDIQPNSSTIKNIATLFEEACLRK